MTEITPSDMVVAKEILSTLQNGTNSLVSGISQTGGKAFEIMVQGTIAEGVANIVSLLLVIVLMYFSVKKVHNWLHDGPDCRDADGITLGISVMLLLVYTVVALIIRDALIFIIAPEYTVLSKFVAIAIGS